ncbi:MAG TPA: hypothetical protein PK156_31635 [Polyangium sp.]|nr:hypothetical protein [Polyangium sp.]
MIRTLAEDATAAPSKRVHARSYLRREILKGLREIETRIEVAIITETEPLTPRV